MTPEEVIKFIADEGVEMIDLKFTDLLGTLQHFGVPPSAVTEGLFERGTGFDGSSIRGFQTIDQSDMLIVPVASTANIDPVYSRKTLSLICDVRDPATGGDYSRDPRNVAQKAEAYLASTGIGDASYWGPEAEFFIFDAASYDQNAHSAHYSVDSDEGVWNAGSRYMLDGKTLGRGYRTRHKGGYSPAPPVDHLSDIRAEMAIDIQKFGMEVEKHHHEVATAGQGEITVVYDTLTKSADNTMIYKYLVKNVAARHGKVATFMPKPLFGDNGTGMHTNQSVWKDGTNVFYGDGYAHMSDTMKFYIGGLLKHAPALLAFAAPTTNSYRRLVPGFEAPVNLAYSSRNRSACCRIPADFDTPSSKRIEFRCPDPTANPYLAFSAMLLAGLDGIQNRIDPGDPMDVDLYDLSPEEAMSVEQVPGSLEDVLDALEDDHEFLLAGGVFTPDLIETWLDYKRVNEVDEMRLRPHPHEFFLYFDA